MTLKRLRPMQEADACWIDWRQNRLERWKAVERISEALGCLPVAAESVLDYPVRPSERYKL